MDWTWDVKQMGGTAVSRSFVPVMVQLAEVPGSQKHMDLEREAAGCGYLCATPHSKR